MHLQTGPLGPEGSSTEAAPAPPPPGNKGPLLPGMLWGYGGRLAVPQQLRLKDQDDSQRKNKIRHPPLQSLDSLFLLRQTPAYTGPHVPSQSLSSLLTTCVSNRLQALGEPSSPKPSLTRVRGPDGSQGPSQRPLFSLHLKSEEFIWAEQVETY